MRAANVANRDRGAKITQGKVVERGRFRIGEQHARKTRPLPFE